MDRRGGIITTFVVSEDEEERDDDEDETGTSNEPVEEEKDEEAMKGAVFRCGVAKCGWSTTSSRLAWCLHVKKVHHMHPDDPLTPQPEVDQVSAATLDHQRRLILSARENKNSGTCGGGVDDKKRYQCPYDSCKFFSETFVGLTTFRNHLHSFHKPDVEEPSRCPFQDCSAKGTKWISVRSLNTHLKSVHQVKPKQIDEATFCPTRYRKFLGGKHQRMECTVVKGCGAQFWTKYGLYLHVKSKHGITNPDSVLPLEHRLRSADLVDKRSWSCVVESCPKKFISRHSLRLHLKTWHRVRMPVKQGEKMTDCPFPDCKEFVEKKGMDNTLLWNHVKEVHNANPLMLEMAWAKTGTGPKPGNAKAKASRVKKDDSEETIRVKVEVPETAMEEETTGFLSELAQPSSSIQQVIKEEKIEIPEPPEYDFINENEDESEEFMSDFVYDMKEEKNMSESEGEEEEENDDDSSEEDEYSSVESDSGSNTEEEEKLKHVENVLDEVVSSATKAIPRLGSCLRPHLETRWSKTGRRRRLKRGRSGRNSNIRKHKEEENDDSGVQRKGIVSVSSNLGELEKVEVSPPSSVQSSIIPLTKKGTPSVATQNRTLEKLVMKSGSKCRLKCPKQFTRTAIRNANLRQRRPSWEEDDDSVPVVLTKAVKTEDPSRLGWIVPEQAIKMKLMCEERHKTLKPPREKVKLPKPEKKVKCDKCGINYLSIASLKKHQRTCFHVHMM